MINFWGDKLTIFWIYIIHTCIKTSHSTNKCVQFCCQLKKLNVNYKEHTKTHTNKNA
jgi:hypothetical protein